MPGSRVGSSRSCRLAALLHDVLTREVTLALLQDLQHRLADAVGEHIAVVGGAGAGHILGHEVAPFVHAGIVLPGGIVRILHVARSTTAEVRLVPLRFWN